MSQIVMLGKGTANELIDDESFQNITVFQEISQYVRRWYSIDTLLKRPKDSFARLEGITTEN